MGMDDGRAAAAPPRAARIEIPGGALLGDLRSTPVTLAVVAGGIALLSVLLLLHAINKLLLGDGLFLAFDADPNLPSWIQTALFVVAGLGCWLLGWLRPELRLPLAVLGLFAFALSCEQMVQVHKEVESSLGDLAMNVVQPLLALGLIAIVWLAGRGLPRLSQALLWGAIASIAVAQGSSMVNAEFELPYAGLIFFQTLEEVGEMMTAILMIAAIAQPVLDAIAAKVLETRGAAAPAAAPAAR